MRELHINIEVVAMKIKEFLGGLLMHHSIANRGILFVREQYKKAIECFFNGEKSKKIPVILHEAIYSKRFASGNLFPRLLIEVRSDPENILIRRGYFQIVVVRDCCLTHDLEFLDQEERHFSLDFSESVRFQQLSIC